MMLSLGFFANLIRFMAGGVVNTSFTYCVYLCLVNVFEYQIAYALSFLGGILFSYWFNAVVVFKVSLSWKGLFSFPVVYLAQYFLSAGLLSFFVLHLGFSPSTAPLAIIVFTIPVTFVLSRWILRRK